MGKYGTSVNLVLGLVEEVRTFFANLEEYFKIPVFNISYKKKYYTVRRG